ncbi:hypothetical protein CL617_05620 [archaeon]|nr:hypothetical protein [archaeon]|tara:strand:- start:2350 stop:2799 length:450 start_codon:yes stop_codon:yes gene_type:complete
MVQPPYVKEKTPFESEMIMRDMKRRKNVRNSNFRTTGYIGGILFLGFIAFGGSNFGEYNPLNIPGAAIQDWKGRRAEQREFDSLDDQLFEKNGLADSDSNGVDFEEMVDAYMKMNPEKYRDWGFRIDKRFPQPTLNELENAVKSYQEEK